MLSLPSTCFCYQYMPILLLADVPQNINFKDGNFGVLLNKAWTPGGKHLTNYLGNHIPGEWLLLKGTGSYWEQLCTGSYIPEGFGRTLMTPRTLLPVPP